jgi:L-lactate dehydrogenase complex protein LldG
MTRQAIIGAIQRGLKRGPLPADQKAMILGRIAMHPRHLIPARGQLEANARIEQFMLYIEREFGTVERVASGAEVPPAVAKYLAGQNLAASVVVSPHPQLQAMPFDETPLLDVRFGSCLPGDLVSLSQAFVGISETGTLMMPSGPERPTKNNLLPDYALVVVKAADIVGCYEDAFDRLRAAGGMPRNVMLVTGPSRSADIEQTLELGAHGPRRLHVLIIDGEG